MSVIDTIKKPFRKGEQKPSDKAGKVEVPPEFLENRFRNIRIFAPDVEMYHGIWGDFTAKITDESNTPLKDTPVTFKVNGVKYDRTTDSEGVAFLPITLRSKKFEMEVTCPSSELYAPRVLSELAIIRYDEEEGVPKKEIIKENTQIYAPDMKIYKKDEPPYTVRLMDGEGNPIAGEEVSININDEIIKRTTDGDGYAGVNVEHLEKGEYNVITRFEGNDSHNSACSESKLILLVRNVDKRVMIEVEHLAMEFKVSKDKIDTLKEYVIRTLKRNKKESQKIRILDDITFKVYEGERVGILGFNGAGKSTLLRIISGIYEPTEGEIKINGKVSPLLELSAGFDKNYTGKNNIFLNGAFLSMEEDFIKSKYDEILEFSELGEYIDYPVKNYSKGMRAKLGFSIATLMDPEILIIDEILGVGDIKFKKKSSEKLNSMMDDGVTVLLVSHSINQIRKICDRCIWIENGTIIMEGESKEICDAYVKSTKRSKKKK